MKNLAIAYSMKRKAKKMADGGEVDTLTPQDYNRASNARDNAIQQSRSLEGSTEGSWNSQLKSDYEKRAGDMEEIVRNGPAKSDGLAMSHGGLIDKIISKKYSEGGKVANDSEPTADGDSADFDDLALRDGLEFSETGANSGDEDGDSAEDKDRNDIIARAMKSHSKGRNPRPA